VQKLRDLFVDGLMLALPLGAAAYLLYKVIGLLSKLLMPVTHLLPEGQWFGVAAVEIAALIVLLLALLLLGAFAHSAVGRRVVTSIETIVLGKIPGYLIIKTIASDLTNVKDESNLRAALITLDDNAMLGFVVERSADGAMTTVFIPGSPSAASGSVIVVPSERVRLLDVTAQNVMRAMRLRGLGLQALIKNN
jgi:uncharacterized membrane protein